MKPILTVLEHSDRGPLHIWTRRGWELKYVIKGDILSDEQSEIAEGILTGKLFDKIPLYINHPIFKYFVIRALENGKQS